MKPVVLLGPQKGRPTAGATLRDLGYAGRVAIVTAGWQEWEGEDEALVADLGTEVVNLRLYERAERVWAAHPELRAAHSAMQLELRLLRRLYNRRLGRLADEWIALLKEPGPDHIVRPEREATLAAIRTLDAHHLSRYDDIRSDYEERTRPLDRTQVARECADIGRALSGVEAVVFEGGHVAVISNRLRLFGLREALAERTVIACSGAAMALAERVVLFHDDPPWSAGNTEVAMPGLGLHHGVVPLPHAAQRLRLDDSDRVRRLAIRLAPDVCVPLGPGDRLDWDGKVWTPRRARRLSTTGSVDPWGAAA